MNRSAKRILFPLIGVLLLLPSCTPAAPPTQALQSREQLIAESVSLTLTAEGLQIQNQQPAVTATVIALETEPPEEQVAAIEEVTETVPPSATPEANLCTMPVSDPNAPMVTSISPSGGTAGSQVTIRGKNFMRGQNLTHFCFGENESEVVVCQSTTQCTAIVPLSSTAGNMTVKAVNVAQPTGANGTPDNFEYIVIDPQAPVIDKISPQEGTIRGGTKVIVTGKNFKVGKQGVDAGVTEFFFGANKATDVVCDETILCKLTSPPGEEGIVIVTARNGSIKGPHIPGNDFDSFKYNPIPKYGCSFYTVTPAKWAVFRGEQEFAIQWIVKNTGENPWPAGLDAKFSDGVNMGSQSSRELPALQPNETHQINISATAPKNPGKYFMTWIVEGMGCNAYIAIMVEKPEN